MALQPFDPLYQYYGEMADGSDVESAVEATLRKYLNDYLGRWERKTGRRTGSVQRPTKYIRNNSEDFTTWPGHDFPAILLLSPGLTEQPVKGNDSWSTRWFLGLACIALGDDEDEARAISRGVGSACRSLLLHHGGLLGFANGVTWVDERYDDLTYDDSRSIAASKLIFYVDVQRTASRFGGPPDGILTPGGGTPSPNEPPVPVVKEDGVTTTVHPALVDTSVEIT